MSKKGSRAIPYVSRETFYDNFMEIQQGKCYNDFQKLKSNSSAKKL